MNAGSPKEQWRGSALSIWESMPGTKVKPQILGGSDTSAQGYLIASLLTDRKSRGQGRVWIFTPHARRRDQLAEEFAFWKSPALLLADPTVIVEEELTDPDREAERVATLHRIAQSPATPVILSRASWQSPAPPLASIDETELSLNVGQEISPEELINWLGERDFEEHPQIFQRGQFAKRGGILDFFPQQLSNPIRIEFFGDEIESIREFSVETQTTTRRLESVEISKESEIAGDPLSSWLGPDDLLIAIDEDDREIADILISDGPNEKWSADLHPSPAAGFEAGDFVVAESSRALFLDQLNDWSSEGWQIGLVAPSKAERHRFLEILERDETDFTFIEGRLAKGFVAPNQKLVVLSTLEIFGRQHLPGTRGKEKLSHQRNAAAIAGVHELNEGEYVVHADYG
ncbi:MAG: transcription-repair coupling factor, partial [Akkermansiaceae bacterium]